MNSAVIRGWLETHQIAIYVAAIALGGAIDVMTLEASWTIESAITPMLAALSYTTFL